MEHEEKQEEGGTPEQHRNSEKRCKKGRTSETDGKRTYEEGELRGCKAKIERNGSYMGFRWSGTGV